MFAKAPERDEIQIGGVQHEFDADQNDDGITPRDRAGKADGEQKRGENEVAGERIHRSNLQRLSSQLQRTSQSQAPKLALARFLEPWSLVLLWCLMLGAWSFIFCLPLSSR